MSNSKIVMTPQIVIEPRDEADCEHHWSYHTYVSYGEVISKKLCFYCKKVENTR